MKVTIIPIVIGALGTVTKGLEDLEITLACGDCPNYSIVETGQNALTRIIVPVTNHRIVLKWKPVGLSTCDDCSDEKLRVTVDTVSTLS